jgi:hypothetical protein
MAKNVKINGVTYESVPEIDIPLSLGMDLQSFMTLQERTPLQAMY